MTAYGALIEFRTHESLLGAALAIHTDGFRKLDAFSPYPIDGLAEQLGFEHDSVALISLIGGLSGGLLAFGMQWYANVLDYPINVGGRPDFSWPAFIPVTFELTVLGAALSAAIGMLALNRLPKLWHPVFEGPAFDRATRDRFFLLVLASDPLYELSRIKKVLRPLGPLSVEEVQLED